MNVLVVRDVALVTGAGSGIGAAIAIRLAAQYDLILTSLSECDGLKSTETSARALGAKVILVTGDLVEKSTVQRLTEEVLSVSSRIRVLVSNAGEYPRLPWMKMSMDFFRRQIEVNLISHASCAQIVSPHFVENRAGRIVAVSSVLAAIGRIDLAAYISAKSGLEGLVRALARELGPHGVTVNCVRPGSIQVPSEAAFVSDFSNLDARQLDRQCIKRRGQPADVAEAVAFLISQDASFITGQTLTVDGGWHLT